MKVFLDKINQNKTLLGNILYWVVEAIGLAILVLSLISKIKLLLPPKEEKTEEETEKDEKND